jgi:hypothetical protein
MSTCALANAINLALWLDRAVSRRADGPRGSRAPAERGLVRSTGGLGATVETQGQVVLARDVREPCAPPRHASAHRSNRHKHVRRVVTTDTSMTGSRPDSCVTKLSITPSRSTVTSAVADRNQLRTWNRALSPGWYSFCSGSTSMHRRCRHEPPVVTAGDPGGRAPCRVAAVVLGRARMMTSPDTPALRCSRSGLRTRTAAALGRQALHVDLVLVR